MQKIAFYGKGGIGKSTVSTNVTAVLAALETILGDQGVKLDRGRALAAAGAVYTADEATSTDAP